jgi:cytoskeleton protein RodZ
VGGNPSDTATLNQARTASLGESLVAAREHRGLSRETVVEQAHIPAHYLRMLEDDDYRLISDQLYLLPFLRKYASFLDIDPDETAMRLLRDVQRVDNSPAPVRLDEPLYERRNRRRNWSKAIMFGGLIAVIVAAYIAQSRYRDTDTLPAAMPQAAPAAGSPYSVSREALNSLPPAEVSASGAPLSQTTPLRTTTKAPIGGTPAVNQAMTVSVVNPNQPASSARKPVLSFQGEEANHHGQ